MSSTATITQLEDAHINLSPSRSITEHRPSDTNSLYPLQVIGTPVDDEEPPTNAVEAIPDGGYGWWVVSASAAFLFWTNGFMTAWGVLQTEILRQAQLKVSTATITFVGSLGLFCMVAFGLPSVRLLNLLGAKNACLVAAVLLGLSPVLTSLTLDNIGGMFVTAGVLFGIGASVLYTATNSIPVQWFSGKLGRANGIIKAGGGVGATVLPIAAQGLIDAVGLAWAFRTFGFLMLVTILPSALLLKERAPAQQHSARLFDTSLFKNVVFIGLCLAGAVSTLVLFVPPFFLPLFSSSIGLSPSTGAGLVGLFGASTTFGRIISGFACDSLGPFNTIALTLLTNALSMLAIWPVSTSIAPLIIFAAINGSANGSFFVAMPTAIAALAGPGRASGAMSIGTSFWAPGYLLGTPIAGILIGATGAAKASTIEPYRAAIFYAGSMALVGGVVALAARLKMDTKLNKKL